MLKELMNKVPQYRTILSALGNKMEMPIYAAGLTGSQRAFLAYALSCDLKRPIVFLAPDDASASKIVQDISALAGEEKVYLYPTRDFQLRNIEGSSFEYEQQRLKALGKILSGEAKIVVAPITGAVQYTISPGTFKMNTIKIKSQDKLDLSDMAEKLTRAGYERRTEVDGPCQFSIRGGILDFYSPLSPHAVRIELWGDDIDSMAYFDTDTQRRTKEITEAFISPAREVLPNSKRELIAKLKDIMPTIHGSRGVLAKEKIKNDILRLESGLEPEAPDRYLPLIYPFPATLFDYAPEGVYIVSDYITEKENFKAFEKQNIEDLKILLDDGILFKGCDTFFMGFEETISFLDESRTIICDSFVRSVNEMHVRTISDFGGITLTPWNTGFEMLLEDIRSYVARNYVVAVLVGTDKIANTLANDLCERKISASATNEVGLNLGSVYVLTGTLSQGFEFPLGKIAVISQGTVSSQNRAKRKFKKSENPLKSLTDLEVGDYIVHVSNGIGVFEGIVKQNIRGVIKDYIKIRYAGTDILYVPVTQLDMISKYVGTREDGLVKLNKLNSTEWMKSRQKVKSAVKDMAKELIDLYSRRMKTEGYSFGSDTDWQRDFEERFPYEETNDQLRCISEIKNDMELARPMDRLLCGDVGFGKTEVAMRAAFKAVMDGKQVAVLVPTTILAFQHYQTFMHRMDGFPVTIELLCRFRTPKEQAKVLTKLRSGEVDIIIGTHRILQKDVAFKDLGLCIIDEEQRFGVAHKEKLKTLKTNVDVLTLSATPIPRTLNMAMSGIRDMSTIDEPPQDRLPVVTYVMEYDKGVINEAIRKELRRGGQVFYLHNDIESIYHTAAMIQEDFPEAKVALAHGKMVEDELSDIWKGLIDREIDILVCTTIVENGVDIPMANTLIIENSDRLGLSQLYQLRGRVGRSSRRAFAYFTFTRGKTLTEIAQKRLTAIRDFTQFGSGFKIALRDLEIRGAGNILSSSQHGHIESVGYEMYIKLLSEAIAEEKGEAPPADTSECTIDIAVDAHIPEEYIKSLNQRVDMYKRIAAIRNKADTADVIDELIDRFGELPSSVMGLIDVAALRNTASFLGINEIKQFDDTFHFFPKELDLERISMANSILHGRLSMDLKSEKPHLTISLSAHERPVSLMKSVLNAMLYDTEKEGKNSV